MSFSKLVESTRSFRRFMEERAIPRRSLREMIRAAGLAPCAANLQRLRYSIVTDTELRSSLFSSLKWAGYLEGWDGPEEGERPAAYILIHTPEEMKPFTGIDVGIAASYIVLAASDAGIGSCMILSFDRGTVDAIAPAEGYEVALVIALGYPGETVVLESNREDVRYWRDQDAVHHVPKLPLETLILDER